MKRKMYLVTLVTTSREMCVADGSSEAIAKRRAERATYERRLTRGATGIEQLSVQAVEITPVGEQH